MITLYNL